MKIFLRMCNLYVAGGFARALQFMEILPSGESSVYTTSTGSSSKMGPYPVASSDKFYTTISSCTHFKLDWSILTCPDNKFRAKELTSINPGFPK